MNLPTDSDDDRGRPMPIEQCRCELDANVEALRNVSSFSGIPLDRLKLFAYLSRRAYFLTGDYVFRQGEADARAYIIISGKVQMIREYENHSVILNELKHGDFFGGLALLSDVKRLFSARASTNLECLIMDRESFQKLLTQFPEMALKVLDAMIKRIVQMEEKLLDSRGYECIYG